MNGGPVRKGSENVGGFEMAESFDEIEDLMLSILVTK